MYLRYCGKNPRSCTKNLCEEIGFECRSLFQKIKSHDLESMLEKSMKLCSMYSYYRRNVCAQNEQSRWKIVEVRNFTHCPPLMLLKCQGYFYLLQLLNFSGLMSLSLLWLFTEGQKKILCYLICSCLMIK